LLLNEIQELIKILKNRYVIARMVFIKKREFNGF
jgi:hypothetical protein